MSKITVSAEKFAKVAAELVREGVVFNAYESGDEFVIEFTGGY